MEQTSGSTSMSNAWLWINRIQVTTFWWFNWEMLWHIHSVQCVPIHNLFRRESDSAASCFNQMYIEIDCRYVYKLTDLEITWIDNQLIRSYYTKSMDHSREKEQQTNTCTQFIHDAHINMLYSHPLFLVLSFTRRHTNQRTVIPYTQTLLQTREIFHFCIFTIKMHDCILNTLDCLIKYTHYECERRNREKTNE